MSKTNGLAPEALRAIAKRDEAAPAKVKSLAEAKGPNYPPGRMLVASPLDVAAVVMRIPEGRVLTMSALRTSLAKSYKADYTCQLTTGIFLRVCAEAALAEKPLGKAPLPYWRVVRDDGKLLDKLPGGPAAQAKLLERDGVTLFWLGKLPQVADLAHVAWAAPPYGKRAGNAVKAGAR